MKLKTTIFYFTDMSKQFLAPGGLSAECVQVSVMSIWGLQGTGSEAPKGKLVKKCSKLVFYNDL